MSIVQGGTPFESTLVEPRSRYGSDFTQSQTFCHFSSAFEAFTIIYDFLTYNNLGACPMFDGLFDSERWDYRKDGIT